jgi:hypothetical protein
MSALRRSLPKRRAAETDDGGKLRNLEGAILSRSSMVSAIACSATAVSRSP